jgi:hypothetical protein
MQGDLLLVAGLGDSRVVLGSVNSQDGTLSAQVYTCYYEALKHLTYCYQRPSDIEALRLDILISEAFRHRGLKT